VPALKRLVVGAKQGRSALKNMAAETPAVAADVHIAANL